LLGKELRQRLDSRGPPRGPSLPQAASR
jgi:hypothetical protein